MDCKHENICRIWGGWFCPDCSTVFKEKPIIPKEGKITFLNVIEEKPKKKRTKKEAKNENADGND